MDKSGEKKKELASKIEKAKGGKKTITLKSGEVIEAGKKYHEQKKKTLRSWGDELPRMK